MLAELLFVAATAASGAPSLSGSVSLSQHIGSCPGDGDPATLTVAWTLLNPDDVLYEIHLLENGSLVSTQPTSDSNYTKTIDGYVQGGPYHSYSVNWIYTVRLVRISDGTTVGSLTSSAWVTTYGTCSFDL